MKLLRKPDWPTLMSCGLLIVAALIVYHVALGRKKANR